MTSALEPCAPLIGVLALQGAFEEHQHCLEAAGCRTVQVRTPPQLKGLDGIVLPGGESTAMGLIGTSTCTSSSSGNNNSNNNETMWTALQKFHKPTWGTCAGMILLAEKCVGASAVIENGQALIGGMDVLVCRNYFGSQISSFELPTPAPPGCHNNDDDDAEQPTFPGVFIRAPAILTTGPGVQVLGKVVATPCRQAAAVLQELEQKIAAGENVAMMRVVDVDALEQRSPHDISHVEVKKSTDKDLQGDEEEEEKKDVSVEEDEIIELPGAATDGTNAREVICAVRKDNVLCTAFHPELTQDIRWHEYFVNMVRESMLVL